MSTQNCNLLHLQVPPPPPLPPSGCPALGLRGRITCTDLSLILLYVGVLACMPVLYRHATVQQAAGVQGGQDATVPLLYSGYGMESEEIFGAEAEGALQQRGRDRQQNLVEYPATEQLMRRGFYALGALCAHKPWRTLAVCGVCLLLCMLGLVRLRLVTDPAQLWVGPGSQAAQEKAAYEQAFGPFYRVSQLILVTTPAANSSHTTPSGLPGIVTDDHIKLLFDIQAEVDALQGATAAAPRLGDVCFKPLGDACATQSVLQYWQMDRDTYERGDATTHVRLSPEFCFAHWSTACRAGTGAPTDPNIVLGGFPRATKGSNATGPDFANDSTAFVVTYPLSSRPEALAAAEAWEAAFIELASGKLTEMAATAGLALSFSAQRSVEDELSRESYADAGTVLLSYLIMLVYVAAALGTFPRHASLKVVLVEGRVSLALGGVLIVAASVAAALGICGWAGLGATLIIMEVIPFITLAIGVDNVFLLTQAADNAPPEASPSQRAALALAAAGPSVTLAAAAEVVSFALGTLSSMPALQNFAACAAIALALDFVLQITAFPAMLALNATRVAEQRYDCAPWIKAHAPWMEEESGEDFDEAAPDATADGRHMGLQEQAAQAVGGSAFAAGSGLSPAGGRWGVTPALRWYMRQVHAPVLQRPVIKAAVIALFTGLFLWSCAMLPRMERYFAVQWFEGGSLRGCILEKVWCIVRVVCGTMRCLPACSCALQGPGPECGSASGLLLAAVLC